MKAKDIKITVELCPIEGSTSVGKAELTFPNGQKTEILLFTIYGAGLNASYSEKAVQLIDQVSEKEREKLLVAIEAAFEADYPDFSLNEFYMRSDELRLIRRFMSKPIPQYLEN